MITMIILLWIAAALNAPTWVFILGGVSVLIKLFASFINLCLEVYKWQEQ